MNPEPIVPAGSFLAFVRDTDPSLFAWQQSAESNEDIRLAMAYGEICAMYKLFEYDRESPGLMLRYGVGRFLAEYHALRRRRDSMRFVRAIVRARATNDETRARPTIAKLLSGISRTLAEIDDFVAGVRDRHAAGDTFNTEEISAIVDLASALGTHDNEDHNGQKP